MTYVRENNKFNYFFTAIAQGRIAPIDLILI